MRTRLITLSVLSALAVGPAFAQGAATSPSPSSGTTADKPSLSKSCSQQADAKGLHGKARKHFRSACKRGH